MKQLIAQTDFGAQLKGLDSPGTTGFKFAGKAPADILNASVPYLFYFAGISLLVYITMSGYKIMMSKGDPRKLGEAQAGLTYGILGFFLVFCAYWIVRFVYTALGVPAGIRNPFGLN